MFEKIENFDNAVEFLLLKALFYTLQSLRISNNIKQLHHLLKTMRIFAWSRYLQKLVSVGAIRRFIFNFFANQNFSRHRKTELLRKWIALVLRAKFRFISNFRFISRIFFRFILEILLNSQENTCARVSFLQPYERNFIKNRVSDAGLFL